jgi:Flp pilus assembly pilin Flp
MMVPLTAPAPGSITVCARVGKRVNHIAKVRFPGSPREIALPLVVAEESAMFTPRKFFAQEGSDIAEYAVTLAMILLMIISTLRLMGGNIQVVFHQVSQAIDPTHSD